MPSGHVLNSSHPSKPPGLSHPHPPRASLSHCLPPLPPRFPFFWGDHSFHTRQGPVASCHSHILQGLRSPGWSGPRRGAASSLEQGPHTHTPHQHAHLHTAHRHTHSHLTLLSSHAPTLTHIAPCSHSPSLTHSVAQNPAPLMTHTEEQQKENVLPNCSTRRDWLAKGRGPHWAGSR